MSPPVADGRKRAARLKSQPDTVRDDRADRGERPPEEREGRGFRPFSRRRLEGCWMKEWMDGASGGPVYLSTL